MNLFADLGLLPSLLGTLKEIKLTQLTEIQKRALPALLGGQSIVGIAETGSGKTLCYALPLLNLAKTLENTGDSVSLSARPRAAVIVPTRELGEQVSRIFKTFTHTTRVRVRTVLGGTTMEVARRNVSGPFEILVATPGRLLQLIDKNLLSLEDVRSLVFDEADQMLDQGFLSDAKRIIRECPTECQLALFSATLPQAVRGLVDEMFSQAEMIQSRGSHRTVPTLKTENRMIKDGKRFPVLEKLLNQPSKGSTVIFANTREQCDKLAQELETNGYSCVIYRGEMDKLERRRNLKNFRDGKINLLISTDLASRGIDVDHINRVINYHLPKQIENYIHRVGRTARAGREGLVINFVTERDQPLIQQLEAMANGKSKL